MSNNPFSMEGGIQNMIQNIMFHGKLVLRLMKDDRIPMQYKLIPFGAILYFIFPFDIPGPIDDLAILWFATKMFIDRCPPDIVDEHTEAINSVIDAEFKEGNGSDPNIEL